MALPYGTTGSLRPGFPPVRDVSLTVKPAYAFTLDGWFPLSLSRPLRASVTFLEATAPAKLPTMQCPGPKGLGENSKATRVVFQGRLHKG